MRYLYLLMLIVSGLVSITFVSKDGYDLLGIWVSTEYLAWNVYAYFNSKRMIPPMNYGVDYSARGDKSARIFLFVLCMALYVFVIVISLLGGIYSFL